MTIIAPTPITALPTVPSLSDVSTFSARTDAFITALPEFRTDTNDIATNVYNNATEVATLAGTATTEAGTATTQAGIATTQAGIATTQAGIATTQAGNASASYTSFDTRYLGPKAADPALDNQGGALAIGTLYYSTTLNNMRIYDGATWILAAGQITGTFAVLRESHTATAAQTVFNLTNTYITGTNTIMVYKNGVRLLAADYTETSTTSITMTSAAAAGDEYFFEIGVVATGTSTNAGNITFNPAGSLSSTNVQAAITELDTEKQVALISGTNIKTVNGNSLLGSGDITIATPGSGGTTSTASITLTAASPAAMTVTPATPGLYVTLPDATTCTKADNLYAVYNAGDYDYGVKDSAGTQLGWIRARTGAMIGLADNATSAGVWAYYGLEKTGITASYVNSTLTGMTDTVSHGTSSITVDADRTAFLFGGTSCYVIVYNQSTQTWGAATLVRSGTQTATHTGILASTDLLLVCTCSTTTGMETVTISLSDVTPTVNSGTKASTTLAGNISANGTGFGRMVAVGTSWVVTYSRDTTTCGIRAITISGTTPTVGAETALGTGAAVFANLYASGSIVRTVCKSTSTNIQCKPYTVSGSTLSAGTAANVTTTAGSWFRSFVNGNGNIVVNYDNSNHSATIFRLTTTTEAASTVILSTTPPTVNPNNADYAVVSASKTAYISHANSTDWYANILTDTAGTASVGTQITYATVGNMAGLANFGVSGNNVRFGYSATTQHGQFTLDCSGASPVLSSVVAAIYTSSSTSLPVPIASDRYGELGGNQLTVGASSMVLGGNVTASDYMFAANSLKRIGSLLTTGTPGNSTLIKPRSSNSDLWLFRPVGTTSIGYSFQRIEAAA